MIWYISYVRTLGLIHTGIHFSLYCGIYWYIQLYCGIYWYINCTVAYTGISAVLWHILVYQLYCGIYWYISCTVAYTGISAVLWHILVYQLYCGIYWYIQLYCGIYWYISCTVAYVRAYNMTLYWYKIILWSLLWVGLWSPALPSGLS